MMQHKTEIVCGIDIGGTNTAFGFLDKYGYIYFKDSIPTDTSKTPEEFVQYLLIGILKEYQKREDFLSLKGIGIGAPNGNYYTGKMVDPPNLPWGTVSLVSLVQSYVNVPCLLTNDANATALGEMQYGVAKEMKHFVMITLGTGLGSGLVVNGEVVYGADGHAGELGHMVIVKDGRTCTCGLKGCLETYVSGNGIVCTVKELLEEKSSKVLQNIAPDQLTAEDVYNAAVKGDAVAKKGFEITGEILGKSLATTVTHLQPEAIIIFGGLAKAGVLLFEPIKKYMELNLLDVFRNKVKVIPSGLPDTDAAILGAGALFWKKSEI